MLETDGMRPEDIDWDELKNSAAWAHLQVYFRHKLAENIRLLSNPETDIEDIRRAQIQKLTVEAIMDAPDHYIERNRQAAEQARLRKEAEETNGRRNPFRRLIPTGGGGGR